MVKLSKRLEAILRMVPKGTAADIGADHGKLIIALFERGIINHGYAVENKVGPYNRLVKALKENSLIDDIIPLLSDGIKDVPPHVGTFIIAGMGGDLIIDILKKYPDKTKQVQTLIVDAHTNVPKLRKEISNLGFVIADEAIVQEDGKFYEIIIFVRADVAFYGDKDIEFGPILRNQKSAAFKQKYQNRILEIDLLLAKSNLPESRIHALTEEKKRIEGVL